MKTPKPLNLTYQGITMNINRWSVYAGMSRGTLRTRVKSKTRNPKDVFKGTRIEGKKLKVEEIEKMIEKLSYEKKMAKRPNCFVCGVPVVNYISNNQVYCRYTKEQQKELGEKLTPCQKEAKRRVVSGWKKRLSNGEGPKNVGGVDSYKAVEPLYDIVDVKVRSCIGLLSVDHEMGHHTFLSSGPHHRVCDRCHKATELRAVPDIPHAKLVFKD